MFNKKALKAVISESCKGDNVFIIHTSMVKHNDLCRENRTFYQYRHLVGDGCVKYEQWLTCVKDFTEDYVVLEETYRKEMVRFVRKTNEPNDEFTEIVSTHYLPYEVITDVEVVGSDVKLD